MLLIYLHLVFVFFNFNNFPIFYSGVQIMGLLYKLLQKLINSDNGSHHNLLHFVYILGDDQRPILYQVECLRDGRSFSTRLVKGIQNGVIIFNCMVSYHIGELQPVESQPQMPIVPPPEELDTLESLLTKALE